MLSAHSAEGEVCKSKAVECEQMAQRAGDIRFKSAYRAFAQQWRAMAALNEIFEIPSNQTAPTQVRLADPHDPLEAIRAEITRRLGRG